MSLSENYKRYSIKYRCSIALPQLPSPIDDYLGTDPRAIWLADTFGSESWFVMNEFGNEHDKTRIYFFERPEDLILFKLRWMGCN